MYNRHRNHTSLLILLPGATPKRTKGRKPARDGFKFKKSIGIGVAVGIADGIGFRPRISDAQACSSEWELGANVLSEF